MNGWMCEAMDGWVGRSKSRFKDCLQQSKLEKSNWNIECNQSLKRVEKVEQRMLT